MKNTFKSAFGLTFVLFVAAILALAVEMITSDMDFGTGRNFVKMLQSDTVAAQENKTAKVRHQEYMRGGVGIGLAQNETMRFSRADSGYPSSKMLDDSNVSSHEAEIYIEPIAMQPDAPTPDFRRRIGGNTVAQRIDVVEEYLPLPEVMITAENQDEELVVASIMPQAGNPAADRKEIEKQAVLPPPVIKASLPDVRDVRPALPQDGVVRVAIIIDDMGVNVAGSTKVENMPAPLTLAYLPYAKNLPQRTQAARARGHELMVHMPMQPMNGALDGGPAMLEVGQSEEKFRAVLNWGLSQFDGYVGVNNHMGSRLTQDERAMRIVMEELARRNVYFIDSKTIGSSVAAKVAAQSGLAFAERDVFLDHEMTDAFVENALRTLESVARRKGYAIAIGHPHAVTIRALEKWLPTLSAKGIELVPASALVRRDDRYMRVATADSSKETAQITPMPEDAQIIGGFPEISDNEDIRRATSLVLPDDGFVILPFMPDAQTSQ